MVKATSNNKPEPVQFLVSLQPVNEHISTDGLLQKLRLMAAGCGLKVNSAEPVNCKDNESASGFTVM